MPTVMSRRSGGRNLTLKRRTAFVLDAAAAQATMSPDRQPPVASVVQVRVQGGTANTGTVTVNGTVGGSPDSEVLTFTGAARKRTVKLFTALTDFDTAGLADEAAPPTVSARAVGADGSRHHAVYDVATGLVGHLERGTTNRWITSKAGSSEKERTWFGIDYSSAFTIREGDVLVDDDSGEEWLVVSHPDWLGGRRPHHWEVDVEHREGSA